MKVDANDLSRTLYPHSSDSLSLFHSPIRNEEGAAHTFKRAALFLQRFRLWPN